MPRRLLPASVILGIFVGLAGFALAAGKVGGRAPDFTLKTLAGKEVSLSSLRGKVVLVDFWASWCKPCKKELPELDKLAKAYKAAGAKVEIIAINIDSERGNADKFLKGAKVGSLTVLLDPGGTSAELYRPGTMPTSYVVDAKGIVRHVNEGYSAGDEEKYKKQIDALLPRPAQ
jgi:thiol-disulfide isomerase/thioredoxin